MTADPFTLRIFFIHFGGGMIANRAVMLLLGKEIEDTFTPEGHPSYRLLEGLDIGPNTLGDL